MSDSKQKDIHKTLADLLEEFARKRREYENTTIKCGIVGRSGVGKSSLINAITGERLAPVGSFKETTLEAHEYKHRGLVLVDLPGCGTDRFPTASYVRNLKLETYDFFILLTETRFFQDDWMIYSQLSHDLKKPCFLARNKFDKALEDAAHDGSSLTEVEIREHIERDMRNTPASLEVKKLYMVSARRPPLYDFPQLLDDIRGSFDGMRRMRFENDCAAWSHEALMRKRDNAMRITLWYAGGAALNGLNPIPGLDVSIDVGLLLKLCNEVSNIYSLTKEQEEYWSGILKGPHARALMQKALAHTLKYGTEAAITTILKAIGKSEGSKEFAKLLIPIAGPVFAGAAGAGLTYNFGRNLVGEYHQMAEELFRELGGLGKEE